MGLTDAGKLRGHTDSLVSMAFCPSGRFLYTCGRDQTLRVWDYAARQEVKRIKCESPYGFRIKDCSHKWLLVSEYNEQDGDTLRIWNVLNWEELQLPRISAWVVALSGDGRLMAAATETKVTVWDTQSWQCREEHGFRGVKYSSTELILGRQYPDRTVYVDAKGRVIAALLGDGFALKGRDLRAQEKILRRIHGRNYNFDQRDTEYDSATIHGLQFVSDDSALLVLLRHSLMRLTIGGGLIQRLSSRKRTIINESFDQVYYGLNCNPQRTHFVLQEYMGGKVIRIGLYNVSDASIVWHHHPQGFLGHPEIDIAGEYGRIAAFSPSGNFVVYASDTAGSISALDALGNTVWSEVLRGYTRWNKDIIANVANRSSYDIVLFEPPSPELPGEW